jgi:hypothetical protein
MKHINSTMEWKHKNWFQILFGAKHNSFVPIPLSEPRLFIPPCQLP